MVSGTNKYVWLTLNSFAASVIAVTKIIALFYKFLDGFRVSKQADEAIFTA
jgi:hypothetical protein